MKSKEMNDLIDTFVKYNIKNPDRLYSIRFHHKIVKLSKKEVFDDIDKEQVITDAVHQNYYDEVIKKRHGFQKHTED